MTTIHVDDQTEIDETYGQAVIEWGDGSPVIVWHENLWFHDDYAQSFGSKLPRKSLPRKTAKELRRLLGENFECEVSWSDWEPENGHRWLKFDVWPVADLDPTMEQDEAYTEILWPAIATLLNVTDPGTFNSEYLFTKITKGGTH